MNITEGSRIMVVSNDVDMVQYIGEEGTVLHIFSDRAVSVRLDSGRCFTMFLDELKEVEE